MTISELISNLNNQVSLLKALVDSHTKDLNDYPGDKFSLVSLAKLEHCFNSILTLNDILVKPLETDHESACYINAEVEELVETTPEMLLINSKL
jgi:hypothetical protein